VKQGPKRAAEGEKRAAGLPYHGFGTWGMKPTLQISSDPSAQNLLRICDVCIAAVPMQNRHGQMQRRRMDKVHTRTIKLSRLPLLVHCIALEGISDLITLRSCESFCSHKRSRIVGLWDPKSTSGVVVQSRLKYSETYQSFSALVLPSQSQPTALIRVHQHLFSCGRSGEKR
jgi:hypothetical protein